MKSKTKILILVIACIIALSGFCASIFAIVSLNARIETPKNLVVFALPDNRLIAQVDEVARAEKYVFVVEKGSQPANVFYVNENRIYLTEILSQAGEYSIKCKILGKVPGAASAFSETLVYDNRIQLQSPYVNLDKENKRLYFSEVPNAQSYSLVYGVNGSELLEIYDYVQSGGEGALGQGYFNLSSLPAGEFNMVVYAKRVGYKSGSSLPVYFINKIKLAMVSDPFFNEETKLLTFNSANNRFRIKITFSSGAAETVINFLSTGGSHSISLSSYSDIEEIEMISVGDELKYTLDSDAYVYTL